MSAVDVLAVMDRLCDRYIANRGTGDQFISCVTPNVHGDDAALRKSDIGAAWLDLTEARAAVNELLKSSAEIKFDLYELTTPELQAAFDGQTIIAVVQIDSLKKFRAALAALTTTPELN